MKLPLIAQDKANHTIYGAAVAAVLAILACLSGAPVLGAAIGAALAALAVGRLKEWLDKRANDKAEAAGMPLPHSVEKADMLATAAGGLLVAVPLAVAGLLGLGV